MLRVHDLSGREGAGYPGWVRGSALLLTAKLRTLTSEIRASTDPLKKLDLIAQQNTLLGYMGTLGIAVDVNDRTVLQTR